MTVDYTFAIHSVGKGNDSIFSKTIHKQRKKKKNDVENKDTIISKQKNRKTIDVIRISDKKQTKVCSYRNCLFENLKLEDCGNKHCSNKLHHMCQNNINNFQYNGEFEIKFDLAFRCSVYIVECMNNGLLHAHNLFDSHSESENEVSGVKDKSNPNDDDSIVIIFNEYGEEVKNTMHDDTE